MALHLFRVIINTYYCINLLCQLAITNHSPLTFFCGKKRFVTKQLNTAQNEDIWNVYCEKSGSHWWLTDENNAIIDAPTLHKTSGRSYYEFKDL
jgi:hypothetical protein